MNLDDYAAGFDEEPGYLDFAAMGPIGRAVREEIQAHHSQSAIARFGSLFVLGEHEERMCAAAAAITGFRPDQIVSQPSTTHGLTQTMFAARGGVALSGAEYPGLTFAVQRAHEAFGEVTPHWLEAEQGRVTPGVLREQLTDEVTVVAISLVDFRTGYLADLEGIRQVIGDRLLVVDAAQAVGIVDAPYELADVVAADGQKWPRAGWGTGLLAISDRAVERLRPTLSGYQGSASPELPLDALPAPEKNASAFQLSQPNPIGQACLAAALEDMASVGVAIVNARIAERVARLIDFADEFAIPVVSPRPEAERAGIVVLEPTPSELTVLSAALHNHGVSVTVREQRIRVSAHVSTVDATLEQFRDALRAFRTALTV